MINAVLKDRGLKKGYVGRCKVKKASMKIDKENLENHMNKIKNIDHLYVDGRRDKIALPNCKVKVEENITCVLGNGKYVDHFNPPNGNGKTLANEVYAILEKYSSTSSLKALAMDGCVTNMVSLV